MPNPRLPRGASLRLAVIAAHEIGVAVHDNAFDVAFHDYGDAATAALLRARNAISPVGDWRADHLLVIDCDDDVSVALAKDGRAIVAFRAPKSTWNDLRQAALGDLT